MKKYFIFTDAHGHFSILEKALSDAGFDPDNSDHILFSLGDNFDRGPENRKIAKFLLKYYRKKRLVTILGNHDKFFLEFLIEKDKKDKALFNCFYNSFDYTLASLSGIKRSEMIDQLELDSDEVAYKIVKRYPKLVELLQSMQLEKRFGNYVFTHCGYYENLKLETPVWEKTTYTNTEYFVRYFEPNDNKKYVFGHWNVKYLSNEFLEDDNDLAEPFFYKHFIGLDAGTIETKKINILVMDEINGEYVLHYKDQIL